MFNLIDPPTTYKPIPDQKGYESIVIKPGPGVDLAKGPSPRFYRSTRSTWKNFKKIKVLIFYMKKLRKKSCKYRLYIL